MAIPMFLSAIFGPASHILVSKFVRTVMLKGQCVFGSGVVIAKSPSFFLSHRTNPSSAWPPARITADAQATSARNGCLGGIYWKANEDPNFCAGPADVAGGWSCKDQNQDVQYPAGTSWELIYPDLYSRDLLYLNATSSFWQRPGNVEIGLIGLSPSVGDDVEQAWDVKASINTDLNPNNTINMKNYFCSMTSANVSFILNYTNSYTALHTWASTLFGNLGGTIGDRTRDMSGTIESTLNCIVMVGGSGNGANHTNDATQGCLVPGAELPFQVTAMIALTSVFLILLAAYWLHLSKQCTEPNQAIQTIPSDLPTWQVQAVRELSGVGDIEAGQAARYSFGPCATDAMYGLLRQSEELSELAIHDEEEADERGKGNGQHSCERGAEWHSRRERMTM